jgi:hypothetical protein
MTHRMTDDQLDDKIGRYLGWQTEQTAEAPTAMEAASRLAARVRTRSLAPRAGVQLRWALLAALLTAALIGAMVAGGALLRDADPAKATTSYEAVFLRLEETGLTRADIVVVGVDATGNERHIARLPGAGLRNPGGFYYRSRVSPSAVCSRCLSTARAAMGTSGRSSTSGVRARSPARVAAIEPDLDQVYETPHLVRASRAGAFSGPGARLAVPWVNRSTSSEYLSFVDGHTGASSRVSVPVDLFILPSWASEGPASGLARGLRWTRRLRRGGSDGSARSRTHECSHSHRGRRCDVRCVRYTGCLPDARRGSCPSTDPAGCGPVRSVSLR